MASLVYLKASCRGIYCGHCWASVHPQVTVYPKPLLTALQADFSGISIVCMCMHMCVVCMCYMHECLHVCVCRGVHRGHSGTYVPLVDPEKGLLTEPGAILQVGSVASTPVVCSTQPTGVTGFYDHTGFFSVVLGIQTQVLILV